MDKRLEKLFKARFVPPWFLDSFWLILPSISSHSFVPDLRENMAAIMVKLSTIKIYFVRVPGSLAGSRALTRCFAHKSPRKPPEAGGSSQKCRNTRAGHTDFDSASPTG